MLSLGGKEVTVTADAGSKPTGSQGRALRSLWRRRLPRVFLVVPALLAYVLLEVFVPTWPCPYRHFDQEVLVTQRHITALGTLAYTFRVMRGRYPTTLAQLTEGDVELQMADVDKDGWDRPLLYRNPGAFNTHAFDLHSVGANGVDDGGRGDDITNWSAPEPLYYGHDHFRGLLNSMAFDVAAGLALGWCLWVLARFRRVYYPVLRRRRPELRFFKLPVWLGPGLAAILATAAVLAYPWLKAEYYCWRWMYLAAYPRLVQECPYWRLTFLIPRPPSGPHTNADDAADVLIQMGPLAAPLVAAKLSQPVAAGQLQYQRTLREQLVRLLGLMGDPSVVPMLRDLLLREANDPRYVAHVTVAQALRRLGDRSVTWLLLDDIVTKKGVTSLWSAHALELLTWQNFGDLWVDLGPEEAARRVALWMNWWRRSQEEPESEWIRQGVEQALTQLVSDDPFLRASAIRRLRRISGMRFFCEYYMLLGDRQRAAVVWRRWWEEHRERFRNADFDTIDRPHRIVSSIYLMDW
jgi:hypothetical protein